MVIDPKLLEITAVDDPSIVSAPSAATVMLSTPAEPNSSLITRALLVIPAKRFTVAGPVTETPMY